MYFGGTLIKKPIMEEMNFIERIQKSELEEKINTNKLIIVQGPRKVGKKTIIKSILEEKKYSYSWNDCRDKKERKWVENEHDFIASNLQCIVLYEAQYLQNLSTIIDDVLSDKIKATLVLICSYRPSIHADLWVALQSAGLIIDFFAPSFSESAQHFGLPNEEKLLEERLIFGAYPNVLANHETAEEQLLSIIQDAIFTNFRTGERINKGVEMMKMLRVLAFELGNTISFNDVAERCGVDNETIERYIQLLEDAFILIHLKSFHNGFRYELKKSNMVYFVDNGVRNALIQNFNSIDYRNDMDALWKNYVIAERVKWMRMNRIKNSVYFWRTHTNQQMDFIEIKNDQIVAYKTDWRKKKKVKFPKSFTEHYPKAKNTVINRSTYWPFLTKKN